MIIHPRRIFFQIFKHLLPTNHYLFCNKRNQKETGKFWLKEMNSCPLTYLDGQSVIHALRFIFGNSSQLTLTEDCIKASFWIEVMSSLLSHIILEKRVFLISFSWQLLNAVLSVFKVTLGAFSCQKRSPNLVRLNWFAKMHWNVALSSPPLGSLGSSIPEKRSK